MVNIKKLIGVAMVLLGFILVFGFAGIAGAQSVNVQIDGKNVDFPEQQPYVYNGRVFIPLRAVTESMGATVNWNEASQTADVNRSGVQVKMTVGSTNPVVNGVVKQIDAPATVSNSRVMIPLRFLSEAFGANVRWNNANQTASIYLNTTPPAEINSPSTSTAEVNIPGAPWELVEVAKVIDWDATDVSDVFVKNKDYSLVIVFHPDRNEFLFAINHSFREGKTQIEVTNVLKVFFPTEYQEVYQCILEAYDVGHETRGLGRYEKTITADGRTVTCTMLSYAIQLRIK